MNERTNHWTGQ